MSQSKTYFKFKETRSQEDLETLNSYLKRLSEISDILNGDEDLDNETENKLYDEDEELIILTSIAMALVVMAFPTNKFQPKTVWEHYCKYTLHIHPSQATEDQYDYFLDCWSGDDEYQYLYDYYENKYPEYNNQLKHYGK